LPSIEARLRERYPELPKSERQSAGVILEFPGESRPIQPPSWRISPRVRKLRSPG
jgi:hypothetical protein